MKNPLCFVCSAFLIFITIGISMADEGIKGKEKNEAIEVEKKVKVKTFIFQGNRAFAGRRYDEALGLYKKAIELDNSSEDAHYNSAIAYERKGMINESIDAYKKVLIINPDHAQAHNNLGILYEKKEMPIKAFSEFKQAVSKDPDLSQAHYNLGRAYFTEGLMEQAAEHLYAAGLLFLEKDEEKWAENSYNLLKKTNSEDLTNKLSDKMDKNKAEER